MARVILESITKEFDGVRAVSDLSVSIGDGQFVTFLGPSGCGKTTTLRMIAGFIEPTAGRVIIGDSVVSSPSNTCWCNRGSAYRNGVSSLCSMCT